MSENADTADSLDSRYLTGIELFNRGEFFEAHEVWEDLWQECDSADRRFYQALIQAAVAAYHWSRGNATGAKRLYHSGRKYMEPYRPVYRGLAVDVFWNAMAAHLAGALGESNDAGAPVPVITLEPQRRS
jgi:predicted metal-dependent hydrolase